MPVLWVAAALLEPLLTFASLARLRWAAELHDTYYVLAHHQVTLSWVAFCAAFAVAYLILDTRPSSSYPRFLAWAHLGLTCLGLVFTFSPFLLPEPQRFVDYPETFVLAITLTNIGYALIGLGLCAFVATLGAVAWSRLRRA